MDFSLAFPINSLNRLLHSDRALKWGSVKSGPSPGLNGQAVNIGT
jgi:hypothetical protein